MRKYKNKYRVDTIRLQGFDYGSNGAYFVTIQTNNRIHFFGSVPNHLKIDSENPKIQLSEIGKIADSMWSEIPNRFEYAELGAFVIMPDHMHGIVFIDKNHDNIKNDRGAINRASTAGGITGSHNPMLHQNLSRIIRWYKGRVSFESRKINPNFAWQNRFYDRIIWNERALHNISRYIKMNPIQWKIKRFGS